MARIALITGASRGLGEHIARQLHAKGYKVCVTDLELAAAEAVARSLDASGESAFALRLDVRSKADFESAKDAVMNRWGGADILVNNAGTSRTGRWTEITPDEFDDVIAIDLRGTFFGCQVFGQLFTKRGYGRIVNISSLAGQNGGTVTGVHYAAAKGGMLALTKVFARELAASGVTVNAVSPGPLDLPIVYDTVGTEGAEKLRKLIPVQRLCSPEFVADAVALLVAEDAYTVTGACWDINGGLSMR